MIEPLKSGAYNAMKRKIGELVQAVNSAGIREIRRDDPDAQEYVSGNVLHLAGFPEVSRVATAPSGGSVTTHPWKPFASPYTGEPEDRPDDQGLTIRLTPGTVGNRLAGNWNAEFDLTAEVSGKWCYLEVSINDSGNVLSANIVVNASTVPTADLAAGPGDLTNTLYQPLFAYDTSDTAVVRYYIAQQYNLSVLITNSGGDCSSIYRTVQLVNA